MPHTVELIAVGTELLLGSIVNSDAQMLSRELSGLGLNVYYHTVVGDNPQRLRQAVETAKNRADILITTGGLGPTCDDLTKNVLAQAFGKELVRDEESVRRIRDYFAQMRRPMTENNLNQALLPEGCVIFPNDWGTAPGCAFEAQGKHVVMLPGPPSECLPMFRACAAPYLKQFSEGIIASRILRVFGMGESAVETLLREEMNHLTNPTLAPYAKTGEVELHITAKADTEEEALDLIAPVEARVRQVLGDWIYGVDVPSLEEVVVKTLLERGLSLGCAESCTGGFVSKRITAVPGASKVFRGGVVCYTNGVKRDLLGVDEELLERESAVSGPVAEAMALGARKALNCDLAVAVTGVAGPGPDNCGNPEGMVFVALANRSGVRVRELHLGQGRERIRRIAASHALDMVRRAALGLEELELSRENP